MQNRVVIPTEKLPEHKGKLVHVQGWNYACQFIYVKTVNDTHYLVTPKSRRQYTTRNNLMYTNRQILEQLNAIHT